MDLVAWAGDLPRLFLMGVVVFVPGALCARRLGIPGLLSWALGPLVAASVAGIGAVVCAVLGLTWGAATFAAALGALLLVCAAVGRRAGTVGAPGMAGGVATRGLAVVLPVSWLATVLPVTARSGPDTPILQFDPVFHMNALWWILHEGNASSFGGLTRMFGMETTSTTVPAGWHALLAPFASATTIVEVINTFALVVPLVWLVGVAALTERLLPGRHGAPVIAVALAPLLVEFPTYMLTKYPAWPNALAMALLPGLLALGVACARDREVSRLRGAWMALWVFLLVGACLVHPLAGLSAALLTLPAVSVALAGRWRSLTRAGRGRRAGAELLAVALVVGGGAVLVLSVPALAGKLSAMTDAYTTVRNVDWFNPLKALVLWPIVDPEAASALVGVQTVVSVLVAVLTVVGAGRCLRSRAGRVLLASWTAAWLLTLTTLMRSGPLLPLAGLWYMSTHRAMAVQAVVQLPLMAQGARLLWDWGAGAFRRQPHRHVRHRRPRDLLVPVAVVVAVVGGVLGGPSRLDLTWRVYSTRSPFVSVMLDPGTEALARRAGELLPAGARVLGDPFNGSAYVQVLGDREVVLPQLYFRDSNVDEEYLRQHFSQISTDPRVCSILRHRDIGYAWIDSDPWHAGADQSLVSPGLYGVNTRHGFEVLYRVGSVSLVRITACD